jgi:hypothetical protein
VASHTSQPTSLLLYTCVYIYHKVRSLNRAKSKLLFLLPPHRFFTTLIFTIIVSCHPKFLIDKHPVFVTRLIERPSLCDTATPHSNQIHSHGLVKVHFVIITLFIIGIAQEYIRCNPVPSLQINIAIIHLLIYTLFSIINYYQVIIIIIIIIIVCFTCITSCSTYIPTMHAKLKTNKQQEKKHFKKRSIL